MELYSSEVQSNGYFHASKPMTSSIPIRQGGRYKQSGHTTTPTPVNERNEKKSVSQMIKDGSCSAAGVTPVGFRSNDVTLKLSQVAAKKSEMNIITSGGSQLLNNDIPGMGNEFTMTYNSKENQSEFLQIVEANTSSEYLNSVREQKNNMLGDEDFETERKRPSVWQDLKYDRVDSHRGQDLNCASHRSGSRVLG